VELAVFTTDLNMIKKIDEKITDRRIIALTSKDEVNDFSSKNRHVVIVVDYDSVSHDLNEYIQNDNLPPYIVVVEREPSLISGHMLISKGVKAYGNLNMLQIHFNQLLKTVESDRVWTYPELTAYLVKKSSTTASYSNNELLNRLSAQEKNVALLILEGLNNNAIAKNLDITERTVKAHVSSILKKLHINDRISLVLLLR
jgi:two-component system, NarL family, nitrate/nitrite response regulator NarL